MRERLAHVEFRGPIRERRVEPFVRMLKEIRETRRFRGVLFDISSGGGEEVASRELFYALRRLDAAKPVVASIGAMGASGAYLAALGARRIYAYPESLVGSIGVVSPHLAVRGLLEKLGVDVELVHAGRHKDAYQGVRPLTEEERTKLQAVLDEGYRAFVATVAEARHRPIAEIEPLATGEFWTGRTAMGLGLVDALGDREEALTALGSMSGVDPRRTVRVAPPRPFVDRLLGGSGGLSISDRASEVALDVLDRVRLEALLGRWL